jgi:hypothetical protein
MADQFGEEVNRTGADRRNPETREQIIHRIAVEFNDMAGLSLTVSQACRLFAIADLERCERILRDAVTRGLLKFNPDGLLIRGDGS